MNIANKITFWAVLASLVVLLPTTWLSYRTTWNLFQDKIQSIKPVFSHSIESSILRHNAEIEAVADMAAFDLQSDQVKTPETIRELFRHCLSRKQSIFGMIYADTVQAWYLHRDVEEPTGKLHWLDLLETSGKNVPVHQRDWYIEPERTKEPFVSKPYCGRSTDKFMITYSIPMLDDKGDFQGVIACDVSLEWINEFITSIRLPTAEVDEIFLLAKDGTVLADKHWGMLFRNIFECAENQHDTMLADIARQMIRGESHEAVYRSPDGKRDGRVVFMPIDENDGDDVAEWSLGIFVPKNVLRENAFRIGRYQALIGLLGMFLLIMAFRVVARNISRPIQQLHDAALTIASGNLDAKIPQLQQGDEVGSLAESFGRMQHELKSHIASLAEATRRREQIESELRIARKIQMSLVPKRPPETPLACRFDLAAFMEPAKEVGGDFYDCFLLDEQTLCMVIADVSGKGVPASLLMARSSATFRGAMSHCRHIGQSLANTNRELCKDNDACMFITMFAMTVDLTNGDCRYAGAGHNPPFLLRKGQNPKMLEFAGALPVGIDVDSVYQEHTLRLDNDDLVFLYTDGVTEAICMTHTEDNEFHSQKSKTNGNGSVQGAETPVQAPHCGEKQDFYGEKRTAETLQQFGKQSSADLIEAIRQSIREFVHETPQSDDITMLAFKRIAALTGEAKQEK